MVLYRIITVGSTKFDLFQHCLFLLVIKAKNYISTISTFTSYKSKRFSKQKKTFLHSYNKTRSNEAACVLAILEKSYTYTIVNENTRYDPKTK